MEHILIKYMKTLTGLSDAEIAVILEKIPIKTFEKGTFLLKQGEVPVKCYFVLKGCVRQYAIDVEGRELTSNFYTEEQSVTIYNQHSVDKTSKYSLVCAEECVLVEGELTEEQEMYAEHSELEEMTRKMMAAFMGEIQDQYATFISSTPEERYLTLLEKRPTLIDRVPGHQLASYLGMTPESLSRIKKRTSHL